MLGRIDDIETEINRHIKECKGIKTINAYMGKIKELDKKVNNMSLVENFKNNKSKIFAVLGEGLALLFGEFAIYIETIIPDSPLGTLLKQTAFIAKIIAVTVIMYVFGNKHELDLKSDIIMQKDLELEGYRVSGIMKDHLLSTNSITAPKFEDPNK